MPNNDNNEEARLSTPVEAAGAPQIFTIDLMPYLNPPPPRNAVTPELTNTQIICAVAKDSFALTLRGFAATAGVWANTLIIAHFGGDKALAAYSAVQLVELFLIAFGSSFVFYTLVPALSTELEKIKKNLNADKSSVGVIFQHHMIASLMMSIPMALATYFYASRIFSSTGQSDEIVSASEKYYRNIIYMIGIIFDFFYRVLVRLAISLDASLTTMAAEIFNMGITCGVTWLLMRGEFRDLAPQGIEAAATAYGISKILSFFFQWMMIRIFVDDYKKYQFFQKLFDVKSLHLKALVQTFGVNFCMAMSASLQRIDTLVSGLFLGMGHHSETAFIALRLISLCNLFINLIVSAIQQAFGRVIGMLTVKDTVEYLPSDNCLTNFLSFFRKNKKIICLYPAVRRALWLNFLGTFIICGIPALIALFYPEIITVALVAKTDPKFSLVSNLTRIGVSGLNVLSNIRFCFEANASAFGSTLLPLIVTIISYTGLNTLLSYLVYHTMVNSPEYEKISLLSQLVGNLIAAFLMMACCYQLLGKYVVSEEEANNQMATIRNRTKPTTSFTVTKFELVVSSNEAINKEEQQKIASSFVQKAGSHLEQTRRDQSELGASPSSPGFFQSIKSSIRKRFQEKKEIGSGATDENAQLLVQTIPQNCKA
ncbi:MAG: hypothetical protein A3E84_04435 [Gammaproteobacteria bacterium RIFCSPHIGHO2_12_FULL_42_13]|nr:MAG: hypothetical protein A3E84_04435 [Gammaproteobacteria bacterium RIFCSPHIGHO2_12_FULL_42_13]